MHVIHATERKAVMEKNIRDENHWAGHHHLDPSSGYGLHGPVSPEKGQIEYARIVGVTDSIKRHGFDRSLADEDITVTALERDGQYRFCIVHCQHRAEVLAEQDYGHIPVSLRRRDS